MPIESLVGTQEDDGFKTPRPEPVCPFSTKTSAVAYDEDSIQEIDPELLRTSINARTSYLKDFIGFGSQDQEIIAKVGILVNDKIPEVVDALYAKLFEFDITKQVFMERNQGFEGALPTRLENLTLDNPQLIYRKIFMRNWIRRVFSADFSSTKTWVWLDKVGLMHTGAKPFKHKTHAKPLVVPYRDCALTFCWLQNVLNTAILQLPEEKLCMQDKIGAVTAINKVFWIQNDLFARHYINE